MSFSLSKIRLVVTTTRHELEPVEPLDERDPGYIWAERKEQTEIDLNPEKQRIWITPSDLDQ